MVNGVTNGLCHDRGELGGFGLTRCFCFVDVHDERWPIRGRVGRQRMGVFEETWSFGGAKSCDGASHFFDEVPHGFAHGCEVIPRICLLYTSDAADDLTRVDLGG